MIQIDNTLVSLDVLERQFLCDLSHCKGICCVEGDSGAPLLEEEVGELEKALPVIWDDLAPKAQEIIKKQGVAYIDEEGDLVTSIVNGKDCVFTCYDADGTCKCAVEKAYREGKLSFYKPVSCHLYPIRVEKYDTFEAVNYNRWSICKAAEILGKKEKLPVYKFLKEPLVRRFGKDWYEALEEIAGEWEKQKNEELFKAKHKRAIYADDASSGVHGSSYVFISRFNYCVSSRPICLPRSDRFRYDVSFCLREFH